MGSGCDDGGRRGKIDFFYERLLLIVAPNE